MSAYRRIGVASRKEEPRANCNPRASKEDANGKTRSYWERASAPIAQERFRRNSKRRVETYNAGAVGMRSRASRRRLSDNDIRCSASDRRQFPARPAQHVHRRRNNGKGQIQSALASAHGRNGKRRVETSSAGRAGAHRPSEALHPTRSSDVLPGIARERVPTVPHVATV